MTNNFDDFCDSLIWEYTTAASKRSESRYWNNTVYPDMAIRKVRTANHSTSDSQKTKIMNQQQYVGDFWKSGGVRRKNKSAKDANLASIAQGIGGWIKTNRAPGSAINSKQPNMIVKYTMPNGLSKVSKSYKGNYRKPL